MRFTSRASFVRSIGLVIVRTLREMGYEIRAVAVGKVHAHALPKLPNDPKIVRRIIGDAKRKSSRAVKKELPGEIWSAGGSYKPVF
jgi:REP element-mobilizing transposase RayT